MRIAKVRRRGRTPAPVAVRQLVGQRGEVTAARPGRAAIARLGAG
jgi:hypothetical protein